MSTNVDNWPDSVKSLEVQVEEQWQTLGFIFKVGSIGINDLVCDAVHVGGAALARAGGVPADSAAEQVNVSATGIGVTCHLQLNMTTLDCFPVQILGLQTAFNMTVGPVPVTDPSGIGFAASVGFNSTDGPLATHSPDWLDVPRALCALTMNSSAIIDVFNNTDLTQKLQAFMDTFVLGWACDLASQMGAYRTGAEGIGTNYTRKLFATIAEKSDVPVPDLAAAESWVVANSDGGDVIRSAWDMDGSPVITAAGVVLNEVLGQPLVKTAGSRGGSSSSSTGTGTGTSSSSSSSSSSSGGGGTGSVGGDTYLVVDALVDRLAPAKGPPAPPAAPGSAVVRLDDVGLSIPVKAAPYAVGNVTLDGIQVSGLDTITVMDVLAVPKSLEERSLERSRVVGAGNHTGAPWRYTLQHRLAITKLAVKANFTLNLDLGDWSRKEKSLLLDGLRLDLDLGNLTVDAATLLAIDNDRISHNVTLGQLLFQTSSSSSPPPPSSAPHDSLGGADCVLNAIDAVNVSDLAISYGSLETPTLAGVFDPALDAIVNTALAAAHDFVGAALKPHLAGLMRGPARKAINDQLGPMVAEAKARVAKAGAWACAGDRAPGAAKVDASAGPLVDWTGEPFSLLNRLTARALGVVDDPNLGINRIMRAVLASLGGGGGGGGGDGSIRLAGALLDMHVNATEYHGSVDLMVGDLVVDGLANMTDLMLLTPLRAVDDQRPPQRPPHTHPHKASRGGRPPAVVNNSLGWSGLGVSASVGLGLVSPRHPGGINDTFVLRAGIDRLKLVTAFRLAMSQPAVLSLRLGDQLLSLDCLLGTLRNSSGLTALAVAMEAVSLDIDCANCTSPLMANLSADLASAPGRAQMLRYAREGLANLTDRLLRPSPAFTAQFDAEMRAAAGRCRAMSDAAAGAGSGDRGGGGDAGPDIQTMQQEFRVVLVVTLLALFAALVITAATTYHVRTRCRAGARAERGESVAVWPSRLKGAANSLIRHPGVPAVARVLIPAALLVNVGLMAYAHTMVGCSIDLEMTAAGDEVRVEMLFTFSLVESVVFMWKAAVYPLALLIAGFSGAWPYLKLFTLLWCWFTPPLVMSVRRRSTLIQVLDILGKWSLIDAFVMVMMMVAFRLHVVSPADLAFLPPGIVSADLIVTPRVGFVVFLFAAMLSLALNNLILAFHRDAMAYGTGQLAGAAGSGEGNGTSKENGGSSSSSSSSKGGPSGTNEADMRSPLLRDDIEFGGSNGGGNGGGNGGAGTDRDDRNEDLLDDDLLDDDSVAERGREQSWFDAGTTDVDTASPTTEAMVNEKEALMVHEFQCPRQGYRTQMTPAMRVLGVLILVASAVLTLWGGLVPTFAFQFKGLVSLVAGETRVYSLWSVATSTNDQLSFAWQPAAAIHITQAMFISVGLLLPVLLCVLLLFLWATPLTLRQQKRLFYVAEIAAAWSAMEVFIVSIVGSLLEISQFAQFMVGAACDPFNLVLLLVLGPDDPKCFDSKVDLQAGCAILFAAAVLSNIGSQLVFRLCEYSIEDREHRIKVRRGKRMVADLQGGALSGGLS